MTFGQKLRAAREGAGINIKDFAALTGKDAGYICRLEQGRYEPRLGTAMLMAEKLGVSLMELVPDQSGARE